MIVARPSCPLTMLALLVPSLLIAQDSELNRAAAEKEETSERELINRTIRDFKVYLGDEKTKPLGSHVTLRWPNAVRLVDDGATAIWIENGRPQAVCCVWTNRGYLSFCFGLLSSGPMMAELDGRSLWNPKRPGPSVTKFRPIPDAPAPAKTAPARLRQMKGLARRFGSNVVDPSQPSGTREKLRLLPRAIYQYELAGEREQNPAVLDGALFAFVIGTDPELLLMIEARRTANGDQWQYAAVKRTDGKIEVFLDDDLVHTLSTRCIPYNPESDFTCLHLRIGDRQK